MALVLLGVVGCREKGHDAEKPVKPGQGPASSCEEACTNLPQVAKNVAEMRVAASPPKPGGGTLRPGTYVVTEMTEYTGPGGGTGPTGLERQFTLRLTASDKGGVVVDAAYVHLADACGRYWQSGTATVSGTQMTVSISCWTAHPTPQEVIQEYTATDDAILLF